jgi:hypothetical protein
VSGSFLQATLALITALAQKACLASIGTLAQAEWGCGEIGRRTGLKIRWSNPCRFESGHPHQDFHELFCYDINSPVFYWWYWNSDIEGQMASSPEKDLARHFAKWMPFCLFFVFCFFSFTPTLIFAHGGGTDANGCHVRRATGDYHCHRGSSLTSAMGNVSTPKTKTRKKKTTRVYRPVRADFEAVPFRPNISKQDSICACSRQARCTGPRGGVFCVNASGNKRYF